MCVDGDGAGCLVGHYNVTTEAMQNSSGSGNAPSVYMFQESCTGILPAPAARTFQSAEYIEAGRRAARSVPIGPRDLRSSSPLLPCSSEHSSASHNCIFTTDNDPRFLTRLQET